MYDVGTTYRDRGRSPAGIVVVYQLAARAGQMRAYGMVREHLMVSMLALVMRIKK
jgi:hypothetical protein